MKARITRCCLFTLLTATLATAGTPEQPVTLTSDAVQPGIPESLKHEADAAINRGIDWLLAQQQPNGHWSNPEFPALTALPLWALVNGGCTDTNAINRAIDYILTCVHPDGAIFREPSEKRKGGGLPNYNTAVCMVALHATGRADLVPVILKARDYMAKHQHLTGGDMYYGGFGYDPSTGRAYTDLSNSYLAYEAMKLTENVEDKRPDGTKKTDIDWQATQQFLENVQNQPGVNDRTWVSDDPNEQGGFVYRPDQTRAGTVTAEDGTIKYRSMPGMTYAGLLSYIYAEVDRTDPRVKATVKWIRNNWSLDRSTRDPEKIAEGMDQEGLYYMYNVMSKGMAAYGQDVMHPEDASPFNWRKKMIEKLLAEQKINPAGQGYWVNSVSRYWEGDPVLVTAYSLLALEIAASPGTTVQ